MRIPPEAKVKMVTFDVDSTLADTRHRDRSCFNRPPLDSDEPAPEPTVEEMFATLEEYTKQCPGDTLIHVNNLMLNTFHKAGYAIGIVTSRPFTSWALTEKWLHENGVYYDTLTLMPYPMDSNEYKVWAIRQLMLEFDVVLHVDDWDGVREALKQIPVHCLISHPEPSAG